MPTFSTAKLELHRDRRGNYDVIGVKVRAEGTWRSRPRGRRLFTDEQIKAIRKDKRNQREIAEEYGCSHVSIYHIKNGSIYRDVK